MAGIRAAVCREFGKPLRIEEVELRAPGRNEVEVTLAACGICHSDIHAAAGDWGGDLPAIYGHEAAGHVSALGEGVTDLSVGDAVLATLLRSCGHCRNCATGAPAICETPHDRMNGVLSDAQGNPIEQGIGVGAFAEKVVADTSQIARISADMPMESAALLACGVITGMGAAINTARTRPGESIVVIGAGGVGLNAVQGARIAGAAHVIAIDSNPAKLEDAAEFGATHGIPADGKPHSEVREITGGRGADAVLVTVGAIEVYESAIAHLAPGGRMVMVGMPHSNAMAGYKPAMVAATGHGMIGSPMGHTVLKRDIPWMIELYRQDRLKLDELVTGRWTLDRINEAIADSKAGSARRNVIVFEGARS